MKFKFFNKILWFFRSWYIEHRFLIHSMHTLQQYNSRLQTQLADYDDMKKRIEELELQVSRLNYSPQNSVEITRAIRYIDSNQNSVVIKEDPGDILRELSPFR